MSPSSHNDLSSLNNIRDGLQLVASISGWGKLLLGVFNRSTASSLLHISDHITMRGSLKTSTNFPHFLIAGDINTQSTELSISGVNDIAFEDPLQMVLTGTLKRKT